MNLRDGDAPADEKINIKLTTDWYFHDSQDLCFCFLDPVVKKVKNQTKKDILCMPLTEELILDSKKLETLSAIEDVVMVGYPIGLWDQEHNLPIFRKGITASHPAIDFNSDNIGLVDIACFPGSSGSPICILNENIHTKKNGKIYLHSRFIFLGVLFQGPLFNAQGELVIKNIPTEQKICPNTPIMINLGYYIKSIEILSFKPIIKKQLRLDS